MSGLKSLNLGNNSIPPAQIIVNNGEAKQVQNSEGVILWGRYKLTNSAAVKAFSETYCDNFTLNFVDLENPAGSVASNSAANRNYILNTENIAYHNETLNCNYKVKFPYYIEPDSATNTWIKYSKWF